MSRTPAEVGPLRPLQQASGRGLAASSPAKVRSRITSRSRSARAPNMCKTSLLPGVVVSSDSRSERKPTFAKTSCPQTRLWSQVCAPRFAHGFAHENGGRSASSGDARPAMRQTGVSRTTNEERGGCPRSAAIPRRDGSRPGRHLAPGGSYARTAPSLPVLGGCSPPGRHPPRLRSKHFHHPN